MDEGRIVSKRFLFWSLPAIGAVLFIWLFQSILLPFVIGIAVAYLLNPCVNFLHQAGLSRGVAAVAILLWFLVFVGLCLALGIPVLIREANDFFHAAPGFLDRAWAAISPYVGPLPDTPATMEPQNLSGIISDNASSAAGFGKTIVQTLTAGGVFVTSLAATLILAPIAAYFMIKEWPSFTAWLEGLIPLRHRDTVMDLLRKMDRKIAGFVRGQLIVASVLAIGYAFALFAIGLNYGILIGLMAGILNIVPLLGSITGLIVGVSMAWLQTGDWQFAGLIALVFVVGQTTEGYVLTPKLVGETIGMHPLWVFFVILAGGTLAGIVGMLVAIPLAACIGVLLEFTIQQYKNGPYYQNDKPPKKPKRRAL